MPVEVLKTPQLEAQESLVTLCEELLDLAKKGEITELVAAAYYADQRTKSFAHETVARSIRIGLATQLVFDLCLSPGKS